MADSASVSRTLVKSSPELWAELSDPARLARRLEAFGEIRITRAEPEHTVAWEGESARGTVELEPAGWGTKVTLGAAPEAPPAPPAPLIARLAFWRRPPGPAPAAEVEPVLENALEALGAAQRRPFSRG